jgi:glycosyltransferase involved in cell wall biosynthesis
VNLAFIVPRYGARIVGGAETLARSLARNLPADRYQVEVLTTCADNHHTWKNEHPAGVEEDGSVTVRRFPVSERDVSRFLEVQVRISEGYRVDLDDELDWISGSVNSEALYDWITNEGGRYDALVFLPYLFGTTLLGARIHPERSLLIPCLHDEPFAKTRVVANLFRSVRGLLFNTEPERELAIRLYGVGAGAPVVGMAFEPPAVPANADLFRERFGIIGDYLLYFGRKEGGKNIPLLLDCFRACEGVGNGVSLVIAGEGHVEPEAGVIDLPRLEETDKRNACAGALALCQPSTNESFSIVLMEAWLEETPVLVNAQCPVTLQHARASGGGLWFANAREFAAEVAWLRSHPVEAARLGRAGARFVGERYAPASVLERFERGLERVLEGHG